MVPLKRNSWFLWHFVVIQWRLYNSGATHREHCAVWYWKSYAHILYCKTAKKMHVSHCKMWTAITHRSLQELSSNCHHKNKLWKKIFTTAECSVCLQRWCEISNMFRNTLIPVDRFVLHLPSSYKYMENDVLFNMPVSGESASSEFKK